MRAIIALVALVVVSVTAAPASPTTDAPASDPEPSCQRMTAAFGAGQSRFIFFGADAIGLDENFKEIGKGRSYDIMDAPYPEAAFFWTIDNVYYVFSDKYYFSYWTNFAPVDAWMFGGKEHGEFFKDGLDAAGSLNGTTMFIKGCKYVASLPGRPSDPTDLPEGLPCDLDAGLTVGPDLYLFKYDKAWLVTPEGIAPGMPIDTSSLITFNDIKLCPEPKED